MLVLTALILSTHAASLGDDLQGKLLADGPFVAHYVHEGSGAPWLELHVSGPDRFGHGMATSMSL